MPPEKVVNVDTRINLYRHLKAGGIGAEIGVCRGANALCLLHSARPTKMYLVDIWKRDVLTEVHHPKELHYGDWQRDVAHLFYREIQDGIVVLRNQTSAEFLSQLPDRYLDWIYLDGDHSPESFSNELKLAISKVKVGGSIAGHDFVVHESAWGSGIVRSIISEIQAGKITMTHITDENFPSYLCVVNHS